LPSPEQPGGDVLLYYPAKFERRVRQGFELAAFRMMAAAIKLRPLGVFLGKPGEMWVHVGGSPTEHLFGKPRQ